MKNASIFDGTAWQSLVGPPGPSEPSKDAGNILTVGSDGLLMLKGDTQFSGVWTPAVSDNVGGAVGEVEGYWTRAGRAVTLLVRCALLTKIEAGERLPFVLSGLPFSLSEYNDANLSTDLSVSAAPLVHYEQGTIGWVYALGLYADTINIESRGEFDPGQATFTLTYLTDDARLG
jgi:hypothetical protein